VAVLTARQVGKTTAASWAIAHTMITEPGSLSVIACPAQRQSAEAVRRTKDCIVKLGLKLKVENVNGLELDNGSRVLALPGSEDSIRGLTVDGWIVVDEAARVSQDMIAALRPMRAQTKARFVMLSTAWSRTDPFWTTWSKQDSAWIRLKATAEIPGLLDPVFLAQELQDLGEDVFRREYLGVPSGSHVSPFSWDLYDGAVQVRAPLVPAGPAMRPTQLPAQSQLNPFQAHQFEGAFR
jgi:hypothetical protein